MSRCVVCSLEGASPLPLANGKDIGPAHQGDCATLQWEGVVVMRDAEPWERAEHAWRWRRQVARARGVPFREAAPRSPGEVESETAVTMAGLADVAREVA